LNYVQNNKIKRLPVVKTGASCMPWNDVLHPGGTNTPDWEPLVSINAFKSMKCTPVPRYLTVALTATRGDWEQPWRISVGPSPLVGPIQATFTPSCSASSFVRAPFCFYLQVRNQHLQPSVPSQEPPHPRHKSSCSLNHRLLSHSKKGHVPHGSTRAQGFCCCKRLLPHIMFRRKA